ncbi:hypothetical protein C8F01DRAFT_1088651 [Mycena amicta]|nr:hypothetical protein C8F01DRAFT_1088651 [Mycena amicta]
MHHALCIDQVLQSIVSEVGGEVDTGICERSLAYIARTCKTFQEPARAPNSNRICTGLLAVNTVTGPVPARVRGAVRTVRVRDGPYTVRFFQYGTVPYWDVSARFTVRVVPSRREIRPYFRRPYSYTVRFRALEPALDLLWARQDTLNCLLKCLPAEHWHEMPSDLAQESRSLPVIRLHETVTKEDWGRVMYYSRQVRSLSLGRGSVGESAFPDLQTLHTIASQFADGELMPNLRSFTCQQPPEDTEFPAHVSHFVTPKLTELTLSALKSADMPVLLPLLLLVIPFEQLEKLSLGRDSYNTNPDVVRPHESFIRQISDAIIPRLYRIRSLYFFAFNAYGGWKHISQLPHLEALTILDYSTLNFKFESTAHGFPALRSLLLDDRPTIVRDIVRALPKSPMVHPYPF